MISELPEETESSKKGDKAMTKLFMNSKSVTVEVYSECKYTMSKEVAENSKMIYYDFCTGFEVLSAESKSLCDTERVAEIEAQGLVDDYHEYLILYFEDGETATFRNSYVDLFSRHIYR